MVHALGQIIEKLGIMQIVFAREREKKEEAGTGGGGGGGGGGGARLE